MQQARPRKPQPRDTLQGKHAQEGTFPNKSGLFRGPNEAGSTVVCRQLTLENLLHFSMWGWEGLDHLAGGGDEQEVGRTSALLTLDPQPYILTLDT